MDVWQVIEPGFRNLTFIDVFCKIEVLCSECCLIKTQYSKKTLMQKPSIMFVLDLFTFDVLSYTTILPWCRIYSSSDLISMTLC